MGLFDRLFGSKAEKSPKPNVNFGRYSDSYKSSEKVEVWDRSLSHFEKEQYLECFRAFFEYLRDEEEENVKCWEEGDQLAFELYQGSKKITGFANQEKLRAEAKIAHSESLNVGFMRRLIEKNFELKFSRFSLDKENNISIVFDTYNLDGSPYKLYNALKELATNADKQDDLLLDEFNMLQPVEVSHLEPLPDHEKEVKYRYICQEIKNTLEEMDEGSLDKNQYPRGISVLLLDLIYRLDYLTKPEGYMMESLERMHRQYFAQDGQSLIQKNQMLYKQLTKLLNRPKDEFFKEMYRVKATFGITDPINHDRIVDFIDSELDSMDWYKDNKHRKIALSIPGYIVGYCMFYFAVPRPDRELFHLYYQITNPQYFKSLGFTEVYFNSETKSFNKKVIRKAIDQIASKHKNAYPKLNPTVHSLSFQSPLDFAKSYLIMIRNLDMTRGEY
jgi:hypothetical protein